MQKEPKKITPEVCERMIAIRMSILLIKNMLFRFENLKMLYLINQAIKISFNFL